MTALPDISRVAALIGEPTRAAMLVMLFGGVALTSSELAATAHVSPQTASMHLAKLVAGGFLTVEKRGRHRYYRLAGQEVAGALEALSTLTDVQRKNRPYSRVPKELRFARTCYDHLAGSLGVMIADALVTRGFLIADGAYFHMTSSGENWLATFGVDVEALKGTRRVLARCCFDWSERRHHIGGALGAALLKCLLESGCVVRMPEGRTVRLTVTGRMVLEKELGLRTEIAQVA